MRLGIYAIIFTNGIGYKAQLYTFDMDKPIYPKVEFVKHIGEKIYTTWRKLIKNLGNDCQNIYQLPLKKIDAQF